MIDLSPNVRPTYVSHRRKLLKIEYTHVPLNFQSKIDVQRELRVESLSVSS